MMTYVSVAIAAVLFGVMALHILRSKYENSLSDGHDSEVRDVLFGQEMHARALVLCRVFSGEDEEFVAGLNSVALERLLVQERKKLALRWVTRKTMEARRIMRDHVQAARTARDLQASGELQLLGKYIELRVLCGLLFLLVMAAGPSGLHRLATQTEAVFTGIQSNKVAARAIAA